MNKLERMKQKITKILTSPNSPMKRTHWNDGSELEGIDLERLRYGGDVELYIFIVFF